MKRRTKLAAAAAAAALLSAGAAMTSMADTGWVQEEGVWYYYNKDGTRAENEWKKSGNDWYWLDGDEGGAMATDKLIEDDDDTYYVDADGIMVKNMWVKVENTEMDDSDPAEYRYYYMQNSGKAYKANSSGKTSFKTIDGSRYAFDEDGKMLYGWVFEDDASLASDESDWEEAMYYCGSWEDGAMKTGWQKIKVYDEEKDDDKDYWFNFKSNGKKRRNDDEKKINGKYYGFDERGVMIYQWYLTSGNNTATGAQDPGNWRYYSTPEDGARATKGWFFTVSPRITDEDSVFSTDYVGTFNSFDADGEMMMRYYADGHGSLYNAHFYKIDGKVYGFSPSVMGIKGGVMLAGLCALVVRDDEILRVVEADMELDHVHQLMRGEGDYAIMWMSQEELEATYGEGAYTTCIYAGDAKEGDMSTLGVLRTGATKVTIEGETFDCYFTKSGGINGKGRGISGVYDKDYIYRFGIKCKADPENKYEIWYADGSDDDDFTEVQEIDSMALRKEAADGGQNKDSETVEFVGTLGENYYLIDTNGKIIKNRTAAKDGSDWYFYVHDYQIKMYTSSKKLTSDDGNQYIDTMRKNWKSLLIANGTEDAGFDGEDTAQSESATDYLPEEVNEFKLDDIIGEYDW